MNVAKKSAEKSTTTARPINPARLLLLGALLLFVLWLGLKSWAIGRAALALQARQSEVETLLAGGLTQLDPDAAEELVLGVRHDVVVLKRETAVFMPLMPYLEWVPRYGSTLAAAPALMAMADAGTETAVYALRGFKPALPLLQEGRSPIELLPDLLTIVNNAQPELNAMNQSMDKLAAARANLGDIATLPTRLRTLLKLADTWLPLAQDGLKLAPVLPEIMGSSGPRTYLILAQNEDELRPTGGFISGAGLLTVENGRILDLAFQDGYAVDNWQAKPYDFPPQPLYDFMGLELFLFRDANFWPDFPTSAEKAMALYSYGQDVPLPDGAIAIDQRFLHLLVEATGPVTIADLGLTINSQNTIEVLQSAWAIQDGQAMGEWIATRKDFIGLFASAIRSRLESGDVDSLLLAQNSYAALQSKDLQIYVRDPQTALVLHQLGWDGRLPQNPDYDFLLVVDSNMGYFKSNIVVERQLSYQVNIAQDGSVQAELTAAYQHIGEDNGQDCVQGAIYNLETAVSYQNLVNKCYWNYLRLYTPYGSQLLDASSHVVPGEAMLSGQPFSNRAQTSADLTGLTTFANFFLLPIAQQTTSYFTYQLPDNIIHPTTDGQQYDLQIYKQAGAKPEPIHVMIQLPEGALVTKAQPTPTNIEGNLVYFDFDLIFDTAVSVQFK
jgi:hypothetical protein